MRTHRRVRRRLPAAQRRKILLAAAADLIARKGFSGATTAAIVARAGVSDPVLYRHFSSKRHLLICLLEEMIRKMTGALAAWAREGADPLDCLLRITRGYPALSREHERDLKAIHRALAELKDARIREVLRRYYEAYQELLCGLIGEGQRLRQIRQDIPAKTMAWHLIHAALGYFFARPLAEEPLADPRYEENLAEAALKGILASPGISSPRADA